LYLAPRLCLRPLLNLDLNLDLDLASYPAPNRALFRKSLQEPFRKPNPSSLRSS
jgi:hypothetical protein